MELVEAPDELDVDDVLEVELPLDELLEEVLVKKFPEELAETIPPDELLDEELLEELDELPPDELDEV